MKKENIIWKDNKYRELFMKICFSTISIFFIGIIIFLNEMDNIYILVIPIFISICIVYVYLKRRLTYLILGGIVIGNLTYIKRSHYDARQKSELIKWDSIQNLFIKGKVHNSRVSRLVDYLYISTKDGEKYECLIYDPKGFVETLKKLNKYQLLSKDSKYR